MDKTTTMTMMTTTTMDRERQLQWMKAIIIIDGPSPNDTLKSSSIPPPPFYLHFYPRPRPRLVVVAAGVVVVISRKWLVFFSISEPVGLLDQRKISKRIYRFPPISIRFTYTVIYYIFHSFKKLYLSAVTPHSQTRSLLPTRPDQPSLSSSQPQLLLDDKIESDNIFTNVLRGRVKPHTFERKKVSKYHSMCRCIDVYL